MSSPWFSSFSNEQSLFAEPIADLFSLPQQQEIQPQQTTTTTPSVEYITCGYIDEIIDVFDPQFQQLFVGEGVAPLQDVTTTTTNKKDSLFSPFSFGTNESIASLDNSFQPFDLDQTAIASLQVAQYATFDNLGLLPPPPQTTTLSVDLSQQYIYDASVSAKPVQISQSSTTRSTSNNTDYNIPSDVNRYYTTLSEQFNTNKNKKLDPNQINALCDVLLNDAEFDTSGYSKLMPYLQQKLYTKQELQSCCQQLAQHCVTFQDCFEFFAKPLYTIAQDLMPNTAQNITLDQIDETDGKLFNVSVLGGKDYLVMLWDFLFNATNPSAKPNNKTEANTTTTTTTTDGDVDADDVTFDEIQTSPRKKAKTNDQTTGEKTVQLLNSSLDNDDNNNNIEQNDDNILLNDTYELRILPARKAAYDALFNICIDYDCREQEHQLQLGVVGVLNHISLLPNPHPEMVLQTDPTLPLTTQQIHQNTVYSEKNRQDMENMLNNDMLCLLPQLDATAEQQLTIALQDLTANNSKGRTSVVHEHHKQQCKTSSTLSCHFFTPQQYSQIFDNPTTFYFMKGHDPTNQHQHRAVQYHLSAGALTKVQSEAPGHSCFAVFDGVSKGLKGAAATQGGKGEFGFKKRHPMGEPSHHIMFLWLFVTSRIGMHQDDMMGMKQLHNDYLAYIEKKGYHAETFYKQHVLPQRDEETGDEVIKFSKLSRKIIRK